MTESNHLLGQLALNQRLIGPNVLTECLAMQRDRARFGRPVRLGELFVARGLLNMPTVRKLLAYQQQLRQNPAGSVAPAPSPRPKRASTGGNPVDKPKRFGDFLLQKILGKGGMGRVYLARKVSDPHPVALKLLSAAAAGDKEMVTRFKREAKFMLALDHPHIVKAFEVGIVGEYHYLSMEYVPGQTLKQRVTRQERIDPLEALRMMKGIAAALDYGARRGVVHRDLKPENILIRSDGVCKLTDLGLAILANRDDLRLTVQGMTVGTPLYMSPEQVRGDRDIDTRSDVYSLGCTFYHAICGRPPFPGKRAVIIVQQHLDEIPPRPCALVPDLRADIEAILWRCLEKDRERRFQSCGQIVEAIDRVLHPKKPDPKKPARQRPAPPPRAAAAAPAKRRPRRTRPDRRPEPRAASREPAQDATRPDEGADWVLGVLKILVAVVIVLVLAVGGLIGWVLFSGSF